MTGCPDIGVLLRLPFKTRSPNGGNPGSRWAAIAFSREKREQRNVAAMALAASLKARALGQSSLLPALVTLTRISVGTLDDDNVRFALKATRDGVADALGIDDGDSGAVSWRYRQRKGKRGEYAVEVLVERDARRQAC